MLLQKHWLANKVHYEKCGSGILNLGCAGQLGIATMQWFVGNDFCLFLCFTFGNNVVKS